MQVKHDRRLPVLLLMCLCLPLLSAGTEMPQIYQKWLNEDVHWIITDRERAEFLRLSTDKQRDHFVEAFWARRDPTPGTPENAFKEEHYRRIAYANEHFAHSIPGWKTDRGRIYIVYGPPDRIDSGSSQDKPEQTNESSSHPYEVWHYKYVRGVGQDFAVKFVDMCRCGDYRREIDPSGKHELP